MTMNNIVISGRQHLMQSSKLYQKSSTGKIKEWQIRVVKSEGNTATIINNHGYVGGKITEQKTIIYHGKNIGKTNETTPYQQAVSDAESKYRRQIDKGYVEDQTGIKLDGLTLPMLAENFKDRSKDIVYPAYAQPKLNGIRSTCKGLLPSFTSRRPKPQHTLGHLQASAIELFDGGNFSEIDGELFIKDVEIQVLGSLVKKKRVLPTDETNNLITNDLEYWVYDVIDPSINFGIRNGELLKAFKEKGTFDKKRQMWHVGKIWYVPTYVVHSEAEVRAKHKEFLEAGFEGTIIRNDVPYVKIHRTKHLQKLKEVYDGEFEIIDFKTGTGTEEGCIVFICKMEDGQTFEVRPRGTFATRKRWTTEFDSIKGKMLTVEYRELTKSGKPFHCVGVAIRDYE